MFIDGDWSVEGKCEHYCWPSCHPAQLDEDNPVFACKHMYWPENQDRDFPPVVFCGGDIAQCIVPEEQRTHNKQINATKPARDDLCNHSLT